MDVRTAIERIIEAAAENDPLVESLAVVSSDGTEARTTLEIGGETFHLTVSKD